MKITQESCDDQFWEMEMGYVFQPSKEISYGIDCVSTFLKFRSLQNLSGFQGFDLTLVQDFDSKVEDRHQNGKAG